MHINWCRSWLARSHVLLLLLLALAGLVPSAAHSARWVGAVTYVPDGDTLWVQPEDGSPARKIRLDGIDAPEICQPYGLEARDALAERVSWQQVVVISRRTDDYGRLLARIQLQGLDIGQWLVLNGLAWSYRYRHSDGPYAADEARARASGAGLWRQERPMPPRLFRQRHGRCY